MSALANEAALAQGAETKSITESHESSATSSGSEQIQRLTSRVSRRSLYQNDVESSQDEVLSRYWTNRSMTSGNLPPMGGDKPYPPKFEHAEMYKVEFQGPDDPLCPMNWSSKKKIFFGIVMAYMTVILAWGSSIMAAGIPQIKERFHVGQPVAALGISLYVLGFATGPVIWGPLSEIYGRYIPLLISYIFFTAFTFWTATADHFYHLILYRFFAGAMGSAPLVIVVACFADLFPMETRGRALALFSTCMVTGPVLGPIVGGYITASYLGWRWLFYITGIMASLGLVLMVIFLRETFHPVVLSTKAKELRVRTGNIMIYAQHEKDTPNIKEIVRKVLILPILMLFQEPILFLMSVYHGFVYGILYLTLEVVPLVFSEKYHWKGGNIMLPYLGFVIGGFLMSMVNIFYYDPKFRRDLKKSGRAVWPEARLPLCLVGAIEFPVGIFLLCWTGNYRVHWIAPTFGMGFIGAGLVSLFVGIINYTVDTYTFLAASAMAANTFTRSGMAAAFPIFATAMFHNLGVQWAGTLLGCLGVLLLPAPYIFYFYGEKIRSYSKYAPKIGGAHPPSASQDEEAKTEAAEEGEH